MKKQEKKLLNALKALMHDSLTYGGHAKTPEMETLRMASYVVNQFEKHDKARGKDYKFKKGDVVKVWSLQSWTKGGFLNGVKAVVRQDQTGESVLLRLQRNMDGIVTTDSSYEVYAKQCKLIHKVK